MARGRLTPLFQSENSFHAQTQYAGTASDFYRKIGNGIVKFRAYPQRFLDVLSYINLFSQLIS